MAATMSRKRRKLSPCDEVCVPPEILTDDNETESTDFKLAVLASLHPDRSQNVLLDYLLAYAGSVERVSDALSRPPKDSEPPRKRTAIQGYQASLASFAVTRDGQPSANIAAVRPLTRKGKTLHLYSPTDVETHTPCSIIHNFLPAHEADALLQELLQEAPGFRTERFQLFDRTVESPHTFRFYVNSLDEVQRQKTEYYYNGGHVTDVAQSTPEMLKVSIRVEESVNHEIKRRVRDFYPDGTKLRFQSPDDWKPNASFVNCYDGGKQSVGYHTDQLTYLGPRAVIGSLSLGVAREFRVRRIVPPPSNPSNAKEDDTQADAQGQIAIHLPHNSLLVMHAEMQEEWKHAVSPAQTITPHPLAGNKRLNVTYRCYKEYLHPDHTPRCTCGVPAVLRCVQRRALTRGRYMWQCHRGYTPGEKGCEYFVWAEFDEDGKPPWADGYNGNCNLPPVTSSIGHSGG